MGAQIRHDQFQGNRVNGCCCSGSAGVAAVVAVVVAWRKYLSLHNANVDNVDNVVVDVVGCIRREGRNEELP